MKHSLYNRNVQPIQMKLYTKAVDLSMDVYRFLWRFTITSQNL